MKHIRLFAIGSGLIIVGLLMATVFKVSGTALWIAIAFELIGLVLLGYNIISMMRERSSGGGFK